MADPTIGIWYRMKSAVNNSGTKTQLSLYISSVDDEDTQDNADNIALGLGFLDVTLAGQAVAYAYVMNPLIPDGYGGWKSIPPGAASNSTLLWEDEPSTVSAIGHINFPLPSAISATALHAAITMPATSTTTTTTGFTQPDMARVPTAKGSASGITGNFVINGTLKGVAVSQTIALSGASEVAGTKAIDAIVSTVCPAKVNSSGDTVSVGVSNKLGLGVLLVRNTVTKAYLGNVLEGTAPTVTVSGTALESNTITLNSAITGTDPIDIYYLTN